MDDLRNLLPALGKSFGKLSELAQIRDDFAEAKAMDKRECGNCYFHMKSRECPKEHNVNGYSRGPSISGVPCDKFQMVEWVKELKAKRMADCEKRLAAFECRDD